MTSSTIRSLQAGRAGAAIAVAAFHLSLTMGEARYGGNAVFVNVARLGYLGVDFFFVLSGFIIAMAHRADLGRPERWAEYAWRRFVRVYPTYWLYTAVFMLLVWAGLGNASSVSFAPMDVLTTFTLVRFTGVSTPLPVAWTLFHEVAFYALFSVAILSPKIAVGAFALLAMACIAFFHNVSMDNLHAVAVYTASCNLEFLLGMLAFRLSRAAGRGLREGALGLVVLGGAFALFVREHPAAQVVLAVAFALAIACIVKVERAGMLRVPHWLVGVGNASYSTYLLHEPVSGLLLKVARATRAQPVLGPQVTYVLVLLGTVLTGYAAYTVVEQRLIRLLSPGRSPGHAPMAGGADVESNGSSFPRVSARQR